MSKLEAAGRGVMQYGREVEKRTWHCADAAEEIEEALAQITHCAAALVDMEEYAEYLKQSADHERERAMKFESAVSELANQNSRIQDMILFNEQGSMDRQEAMKILAKEISIIHEELVDISSFIWSDLDVIFKDCQIFQHAYTSSQSLLINHQDCMKDTEKARSQFRRTQWTYFVLVYVFRSRASNAFPRISLEFCKEYVSLTRKCNFLQHQVELLEIDAKHAGHQKIKLSMDVDQYTFFTKQIFSDLMKLQNDIVFIEESLEQEELSSQNAMLNFLFAVEQIFTSSIDQIYICCAEATQYCCFDKESCPESDSFCALYNNILQWVKVYESYILSQKTSNDALKGQIEAVSKTCQSQEAEIFNCLVLIETGEMNNAELKMKQNQAREHVKSLLIEMSAIMSEIKYIHEILLTNSFKIRFLQEDCKEKAKEYKSVSAACNTMVAYIKQCSTSISINEDIVNNLNNVLYTCCSRTTDLTRTIEHERARRRELEALLASAEQSRA
eukprot:762802-Hanusia_phi.AAC.1